MVWYASHNPDLFRFCVLQVTTAVWPQAALKFDPRTQYDAKRRLIDLQPGEAPQTRKRNSTLRQSAHCGRSCWHGLARSLRQWRAGKRHGGTCWPLVRCIPEDHPTQGGYDPVRG